MIFALLKDVSCVTLEPRVCWMYNDMERPQFPIMGTASLIPAASAAATTRSICLANTEGFGQLVVPD